MGFLCAVATFHVSLDHCGALSIQKDPHAQKRNKLTNTLQESTISKKKLSSIFLGICLVSILMIFYFWNANNNAKNKEIDSKSKEDATKMKDHIDKHGPYKYRIWK